MTGLGLFLQREAPGPILAQKAEGAWGLLSVLVIIGVVIAVVLLGIFCLRLWRAVRALSASATAIETHFRAVQERHGTPTDKPEP